MSDQKPVALHEKGDRGDTREDKGCLKGKLVQNTTFEEPIPVSVHGITTEPTPMLYQPPFYLSEADFEKIRRPYGKLASFGWSCIGLAALNALRLFLKLSETGFSSFSITSSKIEVIITVVVLVFGAVCLGLSFCRSPGRNAIFKKIEKHFESNKPKLEIRQKEKIK